MGKACKSFSAQQGQSGNAMIYVLIIVALFAALSLTLARQTDTSETGTLSTHEVEIFTTQILQSAAAVKQSVDQMLYSGSDVGALDFTQSGDEPAYSTAPHGDKIFHPLGGGLMLPRMPNNVFFQVSTPPDAGVYLGRFNNVEWTPSANNDVIFAVHQIKKSVCEKINEQITGSKAIPALDDASEKFLVDPALHGSGTTDLMIADCAACEGHAQLCVSNVGLTAWSFYSIIAAD